MTNHIVSLELHQLSTRALFKLGSALAYASDDNCSDEMSKYFELQYNKIYDKLRSLGLNEQQICESMACPEG